MQTLILSCNTGAGHNSCAQAVQEAYHSRGEICNIIDSLQFISEKASTFISNWHTRIYRHAPRLFDAGYQRAESHEDIFCEGTPIYFLTSGYCFTGQFSACCFCFLSGCNRNEITIPSIVDSMI